VRVIADYGPAARSPPPSFIAPTSRVDVRPTLPRWCCAAALVILERLAPKIERAQTLSPEATQTISRLIE